MRKPSAPLAALFAVLAGLILLGSGQAMAAGAMAAKKCLKCHSEYQKMDNVVAGEFQSRSNKAKSISVALDNGKTEIIKFTAKTAVTNVPNIKALKRPIPVLVTYEKKGPDLVALKIKAKPMIKVPAAQLMDAKQLAGLVAMGPKKGGYTLIDSRPPITYLEGHIPGAVSVPFPKMPEMMGKLPKDKNSLVIFYCGGFR